MKNFQNKTRIIKVSIQLRALARLAGVACALGVALFLLVGINSLAHGGNVRTLYLAGFGIVEMVIGMVMSRNFFRFFDRLKNGALFDAQTVGHLHRAGQWWLGCWILNFPVVIIGNHWLGTRLEFGFGQLFASLTIIFVAWLLQEAQQLQEEQQLTV
jgi:hypothetical protein